MKKTVSSVLAAMLLVESFPQAFSMPEISSPSTVSQSSRNILASGITQANAGAVFQKKTFTDGKPNFANMKFDIVAGAKLSLDSKITESFEVANVTRKNFSAAKSKASFAATARFEDTVIEYPDRVRVVSKTEYSYNNKSEYDAIFPKNANAVDNSSKKVEDFLKKNPEYAKYASGVPKANKKDVIAKLSAKAYSDCRAKSRLGSASCDESAIRANVTAAIDWYKGTRTVTETIDVNKIPLVYDADSSMDFTERLKQSNISKEPKDVRLSPLQIKKAFAQYSSALAGWSLLPVSLEIQSEKKRDCSWLSWAQLASCNAELAKLNANNAGTSPANTYSATLLNGFTLGESYSYTLADSYSILWFDVYDIWVSFYAGYGAWIRVPLDVNVTVDKDRLEKGVSENYVATVKVDTVDKDAEWFKNALWTKKAFDGKEAVLEAGAYAKGWVVLLDQTVFNEQIWGKYDWWKNLKIPFGSTERLKLFEWTVEWQEIGLEVILYGIHISGDLKVEGKIAGDVTYECRTLASESRGGASEKCRDLDDTSLKDSDIPDIAVNPVTKTTTFPLKGETDKYYHKNALGAYQNFWLELQRFKYVPDLVIDLYLRGKVGVDTGDYFGWFWLKTPWLKVYGFELDLPTLSAHSGYSKKTVSTHENAYLYGFVSDESSVPEGFDDSVKTEGYQIFDERFFGSINGMLPYDSRSSSPAYLYGGKVFQRSSSEPVWQMNLPIGYYSAVTIGQTPSYHGYLRYHWQGNTFSNDFLRLKKSSELQSVTTNVQTPWNDVAFYYSNATNSVWGGNLGGGSPDVKKNKSEILNATRVIRLPGEKCSDFDGNGDDRSENCPTANNFSFFGGLDSRGKVVNADGIAFPYKKFNFAFHPRFYQWSDMTFAYVAQTSEKGVHKVKTYRNGIWWDIEDPILWDPAYVQITQNGEVVVIFKNFDAATETYSYKLQKYSFGSEWESQRLYVKSFSWMPNVTDFWYDDSEKTLFASVPQRGASGKYESAVYAVRFNGIDNDAFAQKIHSVAWDAKRFSESFAKYSTATSKIDTIAHVSSTWAVDTIVSSLRIDTVNKKAYVLGYAYQDGRGQQFVSTFSYSTFPMAMGEPVEWYVEENDSDLPPPPVAMGMHPSSQTGTTLPPVTDEYVREKMDEINSCFQNQYRDHLKNIDDTIASLKRDRDQLASWDKKRRAYDSAIVKMEEIRERYTAKYSNLLK